MSETDRNRKRPVTRRGSRGRPSQEAREEERLRAANSLPCLHCGNPEIDSQGHCDECGYSPNKSR